jgi:hypothetical protein
VIEKQNYHEKAQDHGEKGRMEETPVTEKMLIRNAKGEGEYIHVRENRAGYGSCPELRRHVSGAKCKPRRNGNGRMGNCRRHCCPSIQRAEFQDSIMSSTFIKGLSLKVETHSNPAFLSLKLEAATQIRGSFIFEAHGVEPAFNPFKDATLVL